MGKTEILQIVTGFLGSLSFGILFNIRGVRLFWAALAGFFSWSLFLLLAFWIPSEPIRYFIVAVTVSIYAEIMARALKTPTTTFHMTALIPLIPGGSLYYTMAYLVQGDKDIAAQKAIDTLCVCLGISAGIVVMSVVGQIWRNTARSVLQKKKALKQQKL